MFLYNFCIILYNMFKKSIKSRLTCVHLSWDANLLAEESLYENKSYNQKIHKNAVVKMFAFKSGFPNKISVLPKKITYFISPTGIVSIMFPNCFIFFLYITKGLVTVAGDDPRHLVFRKCIFIVVWLLFFF